MVPSIAPGDRTGIGDVLGDVLARVHARQHEIDLLVDQDVLQPHDHAIRRRALHGIAPVGDLAQAQGGSLTDSECATPDWSLSGAHDDDVVGELLGDALEHVEPRRVDAVVVGDEDFHETRAPLLPLAEKVARRSRVG